MKLGTRLLPEVKAKRGMFLSLRELSQVTGISINRLCCIAKRQGFPLFEKKITLPDFQIWYRREIGLVQEIQSPSQDGEYLQPVAVGRFDEPSPRHDSRASLRPFRGS